MGTLHSNGTSPSWIGTTSSNGGFSIAMLDYRSVPGVDHFLPYFSNGSNRGSQASSQATKQFCKRALLRSCGSISNMRPRISSIFFLGAKKKTGVVLGCPRKLGSMVSIYWGYNPCTNDLLIFLGHPSIRIPFIVWFFCHSCIWYINLSYFTIKSNYSTRSIYNRPMDGMG